VPVSGGAPREIALDVLSADWTADGSEMAVIRQVAGKIRVEFPLGKRIYESNTWLSVFEFHRTATRSLSQSMRVRRAMWDIWSY
jgi:hypothetical protein